MMAPSVLPPKVSVVAVAMVVSIFQVRPIFPCRAAALQWRSVLAVSVVMAARPIMHGQLSMALWLPVMLMPEQVGMPLVFLPRVLVVAVVMAAPISQAI